MQSLWQRAEQANETFENLLFLLQAYHTSLLQAFLDADNLAINLATFFPAAHPHRQFLDSFCDCQQTLREVANDLLSERFAERTQAPIQARIAKFQQLEHLENLRKRLWSRYERDLDKYKEMVEAEAQARKTSESSVASTMAYVSTMMGGSATSGSLAEESVPANEEIHRMKLIVENEYRLYHDAKEHLAREIKVLAGDPAAYVEPAIAALTLLQSQTFTLGFDLISRVIQLNPDSRSSSATAEQFAKQKSNHETSLATRMELVLSHELDLDDLTLKPVPDDEPVKAKQDLNSVIESREGIEPQSKNENLPTKGMGPSLQTVQHGAPEEYLDTEQSRPREAAVEEPEKNKDRLESATVQLEVRSDTDKVLKPEVLKQVRALHSFSSAQEIELSIQVGDVLDVLWINSDGWWEGRNEKGEIGLFPWHFTTPVV